MKKRLLGMTADELSYTVKELGMMGFVGSQIATWIYQKGIDSINGMTNISKTNRALLEKTFTTGLMTPVRERESKDGTVKFLFPTESGKTVETVFIPGDDKATLCVSSQIGCKMNCSFCQTGKQGFEGQLTAADIINQIYALPYLEQLTNIVFMGQGEPLDNLDNILRATELLQAPYGMAWSPKRITVSTVGIRNKLKRFLDESQCHIAISLHSPFPEQRALMMPAEKAYSITDIISLLREYDFSHQRRLSFEYIVFQDFNDSPVHLREMVRLLSPLNCRVNLIPFHQIPHTALRGADSARMESMRGYLTRHGVFTTIRASRGEDIEAACGMLNSKKLCFSK